MNKRQKKKLYLKRYNKKERELIRVIRKDVFEGLCNAFTGSNITVDDVDSVADVLNVTLTKYLPPPIHKVLSNLKVNFDKENMMIEIEGDAIDFKKH